MTRASCIAGSSLIWVAGCRRSFWCGTGAFLPTRFASSARTPGFGCCGIGMCAPVLGQPRFPQNTAKRFFFFVKGRGRPARRLVDTVPTNRSHQRGPQGVRSDRWSGSKLSKSSPFHPFHSEWDRVTRVYSTRMEEERAGPFVKVEPTAPGFVQPVTRANIVSVLNEVPRRFLDGLEGVFVVRGSRKMAQQQGHFVHGTYCRRVILLFPYPNALMTFAAAGSRPHELDWLRRSGVAVEAGIDGVLRASFSRASLRTYYAREVLVHEIGHHVEFHLRGRTTKLSESFAEWFATEFGFRNRSLGDHEEQRSGFIERR